MKKISAYKFRRNLGEIMNEAYYKGTEFVIERKGKPMIEIRKASREEEAAGINDPFYNIVGLLGEEEADELEANIKELRSRSGRRSDRIAKTLSGTPSDDS